MAWDDDYYPKITIQFEPGKQQLVGDFDTGAPISFVSYEWLVQNKVIEPKQCRGTNWKRVGNKNAYSAFPLKLRAKLIGDTGESEVNYLLGQIVIHWQEGPFSRADRARNALIGRNIFKTYKASVEIGAHGKTNIVNNNWESFESEVANLYRKLGLTAKKNYNLAGNQIDILLIEPTTSGKELRTIVECKFHKNPVGIQYVRKLSSVLEFAKQNRLADHAIIVSASGFTKDAHFVAQTAGVELTEANELREKVGRMPNSIEIDKFAVNMPDLEKYNSAFVITPFSEEFRDIYMFGIREVLSKFGLVCVRLDEVEYTGRTIEQAIDMISNSDIVIAEISERSPDVFYELGISYTMDKTVILCARDISTIPFDIMDQNVILYKDIVDLQEKLSKRMQILSIPSQII